MRKECCFAARIRRAVFGKRKPNITTDRYSRRNDERAFYQWSAGVMGDYPITKVEFGFVDSLMAFTAFDEK